MLAGLAEMRERKLAKPALRHSPSRLIGISHCIVSVTRVWVTVTVLVAGLLVSVTVIATARELPQVTLALTASFLHEYVRAHHVVVLVAPGCGSARG